VSYSFTVTERDGTIEVENVSGNIPPGHFHVSGHHEGDGEGHTFRAEHRHPAGHVTAVAEHRTHGETSHSHHEGV
jgi:hypothetical protein